MLAYVCFLCRWMFCSGGFIQVFFFIWRLKKWSLVKLDRWSSYRVMTVWGFAWADLALVILDELSSYRAGCLNRFDCSIKCYWNNKIYFSLYVFLGESINEFSLQVSKLILFMVVLFLSYILYNMYWKICHLWRRRIDMYQIGLLFSGF